MGKKKKKAFADVAQIRQEIEDGVREGIITEEEAQIMRNELVSMYNIINTQMLNRQKHRF